MQECIFLLYTVALHNEYQIKKKQNHLRVTYNRNTLPTLQWKHSILRNNSVGGSQRRTDIDCVQYTKSIRNDYQYKNQPL